MTNEFEALQIKRREALTNLVNARLTSIQFVLNYLILGFDEKGALTTLVWPEVENDGKSATFGAPGYRDDLCSLIERIVNHITMGIDETIHIEFKNGGNLRIPLGSYKATGDRAILTGPKHLLFVF